MRGCINSLKCVKQNEKIIYLPVEAAFKAKRFIKQKITQDFCTCTLYF